MTERLMMQIRKIYKDVKPELLYDELRDFIQKRGVVLDEAKLETYSLPGGSAHIVRGTLTFNVPGSPGKGGAPSLRAHVVGSAIGETKVILDIDDTLFPQEKIGAVQEDLDFIFGSYEVKPVQP
ncbi:MAG TPA: hypothetical protein G4O09_01060 [Dehalococcoidia bacterium]|nr:hypothetical protein [Dehalococcoidia bacterium]